VSLLQAAAPFLCGAGGAVFVVALLAGVGLAVLGRLAARSSP
jgi:hypothetical protein